jgi:Calcineurin-like phosphoesterase
VNLLDTIPLHCLVLCEVSDRLDSFAPHELVDLDTISHQLVGITRRHDLAAIVYGELRHRVSLKLSLGERTVVDTRGLTGDQRRQLASIANHQGATLITIGSRLDGSFTVRPDATLNLILPLPVRIDSHLRAQWEGITVIGDVHGELAPLQRALDWARSRHHFAWLLGDLIDYGPDTLATIETVHHAVMHGEAAMVLANHERKIARWLDRDSDHHVRLSDGNRVTIAALDRLTMRERTQWTGRFRALLAHTALTQQIGNLTLMHAAAHPSLWNRPDRTAIEQYALYGESDQSDGRYRRTHRWVDAVPDGKMVIVGHNIMSDYPLVMTGAQGGKVIFLDTGCGKGGLLSSADLRFTQQELRLECFNRQ